MARFSRIKSANGGGSEDIKNAGGYALRGRKIQRFRGNWDSAFVDLFYFEIVNIDGGLRGFVSLISCCFTLLSPVLYHAVTRNERSERLISGFRR